MKTLKVFLASSDELKDERQKFGNLIRHGRHLYQVRHTDSAVSVGRWSRATTTVVSRMSIMHEFVRARCSWNCSTPVRDNMISTFYFRRRDRLNAKLTWG